MNKRTIRIIIVMMSIALAGIISIQIYWIRNDFLIKEQQFEQSVLQGLNTVVDKLETKEAMSVLHQNLFSINPDSISEMMLANADNTDTASFLDTTIITPGLPYAASDRLSSDLDNANVNIDFQRPGSQQSFLRVQRKNIVRSDSNSKQTISSSQITRIFGDSAEVVIRQNEEKVKARLSKLNEVMQKMAIEFAGNDEDVRKRLRDARLDSLLKGEFDNKGIHLPFNYGIYNKPSNTFLLSNLQKPGASLLQSTYRTVLFPNDLIARPDYLIVEFSGTFAYLINSIWIMLLSSAIMTFIVVFGFAYTISVMLRQKKISDIKSDFINNMTHEFKTPLATISLAVDSLNNPKVTGDLEKTAYFTKIIKEENKRMNNQVERVLQMAQIDKGELKMKWEQVDLHELIRHAIEQIKLQVENRNGKITADLQASDSFLTGDPVHLSNLIFNLLDNANKYSENAPEITISTHSGNEGILMKVTDKGVGMTKEAQKKIFDKFYRVPTGNIHTIKGFGLGLSYVQAIINEHHGDIQVDSDIGKGSTFECFMPHQQPINS